MPSIPPTPVKMTDEKEKTLAPHNMGIEPPIAEPIAIKIQISDLFIIIIRVYYNNKQGV